MAKIYGNFKIYVICAFAFFTQISSFPYRNDKYDTFDWDLFKSVSKSCVGKNSLLSPFSIKILLSLLAEGAEGETQKQLLRILPNISSDSLRNLSTNILQSLEEKNWEYELNIGTKLFIDKKLKPDEKFVTIAESQYHAPVENVIFSDSSETADFINKWCFNTTNGSIKEFVEAGNIKDYVALLANAIYFKGKWESQFFDGETIAGPFFTNRKNDTPVQAQMMTVLGYFYFINSDEFKAKLLRLPYKGDKYAMTIILPNNPKGLDELIETLKPDQLQNIQGLMKRMEVMVRLPKFEFKSSLHLKNNLEELGIKELFGKNSQLPGLRGKSNILLEIDDVFQKAGIIVDEKGTEIYASSGAIASTRFGGGPENFSARHPFLFFIEDETTGALLFTGKVVDPTATD